MAKPKEQFKIEKITDGIFHLYAIDLIGAFETAKSIEGVESASIAGTDKYVTVFTSPLYDMGEIIAELEQLLAPIPDAFKDEE